MLIMPENNQKCSFITINLMYLLKILAILENTESLLQKNSIYAIFMGIASDLHKLSYFRPFGLQVFL